VVYPRAWRAKVKKNVSDVDARAFNASLPVDERIVALWSFHGAPAFTMIGARSLAETIGELLNDDDLVLASEAYEALCNLYLDDGDALRDLAVGIDKRGRLMVAGKRVDAIVHDTEKQRLVPLVKIGMLAASANAAVLAWPQIVKGDDVVLERAAHANLKQASLRVRGDEALVGTLREAMLKLAVPRRQVRFKRGLNDAWTVQDVYAEGFVSIKGQRLSTKMPVAHNTRVDIAHDDGRPATSITVRFAPKLDRAKGVTVKYRDRGAHVERLAPGEALFFGTREDDDVTTTTQARIVATPKDGPVLVTATDVPQMGGVFHLGSGVGVKFDRNDVVIVDV
jgi:hypothetical protein